MPATASFRSRPFRKIRDAMSDLNLRSTIYNLRSQIDDRRLTASSECDFPNVGRQRVERQELTRPRTVSRELELRQERLVDLECVRSCHLGRVRRLEQRLMGDAPDMRRRDLASGFRVEAASSFAIEEDAEANEQPGGGRGGDPAPRRAR